MANKISTPMRMSVNFRRALTAFTHAKTVTRTAAVEILAARGMGQEMIDGGVAPDDFTSEPEAVFIHYAMYIDVLKRGDESEYYLVNPPTEGYWATRPRGLRLLHRSWKFYTDGITRDMTYAENDNPPVPDWLNEGIPENLRGDE